MPEEKKVDSDGDGNGSGDEENDDSMVSVIHD